MLRIIAALFLLALAACTLPSPYMKGKSAADIPARVNVILLKPGYVLGNTHNASNIEWLGEDVSPTPESVQMLATAKASAISQLTNLGYKVVEDPKAKADIQMMICARYYAMWPLANDLQIVRGIVYNAKGELLFHLEEFEERPGLLGLLLSSRDKITSKEARNVIIAIDKERLFRVSSG